MDVSCMPQGLRSLGRLVHHAADCLRNERGATAVEYGLMIALIGSVMAGGASQIDPGFQSLANRISVALNR